MGLCSTTSTVFVHYLGELPGTDLWQRGGARLGSILITGAQVGRQQKVSPVSVRDDKNYRHALLIIEAKPNNRNIHRHVLCAESDEERDQWVDILVRYHSGTYDADPSAGLGAAVAYLHRDEGSGD